MVDPILSVAQVLALVGISRRTLYREIHHGSFPKPLQISMRRVGWRESTVESWMIEKAREKARA